MKTSRRLLSFLFALALLATAASGQTTWTLRNQNPGTSDILWSVAEGNAGVVAVGEKGVILQSLDGRTWNRRTSGTTVWLVAVTFGNGRYVAVGEGGTILTSTNATTWSPVALSGTTARLNNVLYAQNKFVAVGEGGVILVSTDGATWNAVSSGVTGVWLRGLAFSNGDWIATGQGGAVTTSYDGINWTRRTMPPTTPDFEAVVPTGDSGGYTYSPTYSYAYTNFLAVGANGAAYVLNVSKSLNGTTVTSSSLGFSSITIGTSRARFRSVSSVNKVFVASGEDGSVYTAKSQWGPWTRVTLNTTQNLVGAGAAFGSLLLVGSGETIFQSEQIFVSRLGNIATRGVASSGANAMIAGTVIQGPRPKQMLIRGVGPALAGFSVPNTLADPVLGVYDSTGRLVATNSGWSTNLNPAALASAAVNVGAFALAPNSKDAALLLTLSPGAYTFQVSSASGGSGNALVEAYDLDAIDATSPRAINIATRGQVGTGDNILIAGIVVQGQSSRTLLVRGVGPTLGQFIGGTLVDPLLKIVDSTGAVLATNDNWNDSTITNGRLITADDVSAAAALSGAFALSAGSKDAATIITLVPGNYTVQVSGVGNTTGLALVEVYDIPNN